MKNVSNWRILYLNEILILSISGGGPSFNFNLESESTSQGAPVEDLGELELQVKNIKVRL